MRTSLAAVILALLCLQAWTGSTRAAPTAADEAESCVCTLPDTSKALQLIRGKDQVDRCEQGDYCDCQTKTVQHCDDLLLRFFNEEIQKCDFLVYCDTYLEGSTEEPSTASPPTLPSGPPTAAAETTAATPTSTPESCSCTLSDVNKALQLIRGKDQVAHCVNGDYCNCETKTVQHCDNELFRFFNEEIQKCDFLVYCDTYLEGSTEEPSTASPPTLPSGLPTAAAETTAAAPTSTPESCSCTLSDVNKALQLIRGKDQMARCVNGDYCNCETKTVRQCDSLFVGTPMVFNEELQMCDFSFDCGTYLEGSTEEPLTASPSTSAPTRLPASSAALPTPAPTPCACEDAKLPMQLIRGANEVDRCRAGDYCACETKAVRHCDSLFVGTPMVFNEELQMCDFTLDCQVFLDGTRTTVAPDGSGGLFPSSGGYKISLSATLFSLTAILTIFNLGLLLYWRTCWSGARRLASPRARHADDNVPVVYSPDFLATRKAPLESGA